MNLSLRRAALAAAAVLAVAGVSTPAHAAPATTDRLAGADLYATSVAISKHGFPGTSKTVYVASGQDFADALAGSAAAGAQGAPLLLTQKDALPAGIKAEVQRLKPAAITVLGGDAAVSPAVRAELGRIAKVQVIAGADRYDTAAKVAAAAYPAGTPTAYLASGVAFPDALAGASAAVKAKAPVLLTRPDSLPAPTATALKKWGTTKVQVLGGTAAVQDAPLAGLPAERVQGADRYGTAVAISKASFATGSPVVYVANGNDYPDALGGGALAAGKAPVLLVRANTQVPEVCQEVNRLKPNRVVALGGTSVVSDAVLTGLATCATTATPAPVPTNPDTCTPYANYDLTIARDGLSDLVAAVKIADGRIGNAGGSGGVMTAPADAARRVALGVPNVCAESVKAMAKDFSDAEANRGSQAASEDAYKAGRAKLVALLPELNKSLSTNFQL